MILPKMSKIVHFIAFFIATKHYQTSFETKKERRQYPFPKIPVFHLYECAQCTDCPKMSAFSQILLPVPTSPACRYQSVPTSPQDNQNNPSARK